MIDYNGFGVFRYIRRNLSFITSRRLRKPYSTDGRRPAEMQRFRALASARRSIPSLRRALSTTRPSSAHDHALQDEVSLPSILIPAISLPIIAFRFSLLIVEFSGARRGQGGCPYRNPQPALCSQCSDQQHGMLS